MLSRNEARQPLSRTRGPVGTRASSSNQNRLCADCLRSPFGPGATRTYKDAWGRKLRKAAVTYERSARQIWESALLGCPWCVLVGDAVILSLDMDVAFEFMNEREEGGSNNGEDISGGEEEEDIDESGDESGDDSGINEDGSFTLPNTDVPVKEYFDKFPRWYGDREESSERYRKLDSPAICHIVVSYVSEEIEPRSGYNGMEVCIEVESAEPPDPLASLTGEKAVLFTCNLQAEEGSAAGEFVSARPYSTGLALEATVEQAKQWLGDCQGHEACHHTLSGFTPTRVIDVQDLGKPRLHTTGPGENFEYVALSYVWGMDQSYVTTSETIQEKTNTGLDTVLLPGTITDAMKVTHALGYRYLWIDSLCIIQNSKEDKRKEISKMRLIYQNSRLTIAAARSATVADGFLYDIPPPRYYLEPFDVPFHCPTGVVDPVTVSYKADYVRGNDPWNSRAWTLEEQLLSPRLLIYSNDGLKWLCKFDALQAHDPFGFGQAFLSLPWSIGGQPHDMDPEVLQALWQSMVSEYTQREVTHAKDKLIAFAAVAEEFHRVQGGGGYLAGLWKEHLFFELLWRRVETQPPLARPTKYRAPSWSWATVDGETCSPDIPREPEFSEILDCTVDLKSDILPFGMVTGGTLTVRGPLARPAWRSQDAKGLGCDGVVYVISPNEETATVVGEVVLDALEPSLDGEGGRVAYLLPMAIVHENSDEIEGLVLLPAGKETYRRIGLFSGCWYRDWFLALKAEDVVIV